MIDLLVGLAPVVGVIGVWILLQAVVLPRLGVGT
jgi:hypothetical protein